MRSTNTTSPLLLSAILWVPLGVYDISHTRNFVYFECFFGFRMPFENGPNFAKLYENFPAIFLCKSIQNSGYFEKSVTFYTNFSTIHHRRHILHTAEKLQDADWGWGGGEVRQYTPHPPPPPAGHPQRRGAQQAAVRCDHRPGWCPPQHPGCPPAQEVREDQGLSALSYSPDDDPPPPPLTGAGRRFQGGGECGGS
jgi:hypothetical protein